jgi:hypothetical protein
MAGEEIVTRSNRVRLGEDGIVRSVSLPDIEQTLEGARDNIAAIAQVSGGVRRPVLADLTGAKSITRQARMYYAGAEAAATYAAVALLVGSPLSVVLGRFVLAISRPPRPVQMFTSEEEALAWLRGFLA